MHAEFLAGRLKVSWPTPGQEATRSNQVVRVVTSFGDVGHWPARDWRSQPMAYRRGVWEQDIFIADLDSPVLYFIVTTNDQRQTAVAPMRILRPRAMGMELPTRFYWPFLEGFEEGLESWKLLSPRPSAPALATDPLTKRGRASLRIAVSKPQDIVTVTTTRVRGTEIVRESASGLSLWMRTRSGDAEARFALRANAFTTNEISAQWKQPVRFQDRWQRVDLAFRDIPDLPLGAVDLFILEFTAPQAIEILIDELELTTRFRSGFE